MDATPHVPEFRLDSVGADQRRYLPHWRMDDAVYFVTFRLADALPRQKTVELISRRNQWLMEHLPPRGYREIHFSGEKGDWLDMDRRNAIGMLSDESKAEYRREFTGRVQTLLDSGYGACHLRRPDVAAIVASSLEHFHEDRYQLFRYVVMPNHVHALMKPHIDLAKILHSWKSYSAKQINRLLGRQGTFWQDESYDRIVRGQGEYQFRCRYVDENPAKAGLREGEYTLWRQG